MFGMSPRHGAARRRALTRSSTAVARRRLGRRLGVEALESRELLTVVQFDTTLGSFRVTLEDTAKPITVTNFLNYVNNNRYADSFVHRSATSPGVIQGGGFRFTNETGVVQVQTNAQIQNEPGISNVRGTIAMAKTSDPNSATSQWFVNVTNNSVSLDNPANSGGFTVFGHVIANGMTVVDAIAAAQRVNAGTPFGELPVVNYSGGTVTGANLIFTAVNVVPDVAPVIPGVAVQTAHQGQTLTFDVPIQDADLPREQFTFELVSGPPGAAFVRQSAGIGRFTWTPPLSQTPGDYTATVRVKDLSDKTAERVINLTLANDVPVAKIDDVPTTASGFNFSQFVIRFNEAVTGFDVGDLQLTRDGGSNLLTGAQTLTTGDNAVYTLGNLTGLTDPPGVYRLTVRANASGIQDGTGQNLAADAAKTWHNVGAVTQSLLLDQTLTPDGTVYRIVAGISGGLTVEYSLDPQQGAVTKFELRDLAGGTPPTIVPSGANGRIDYRVTPGQSLLLVVEGTNPDVAIRMTNLLELDTPNLRATLHGLPGNDRARFFVEGERVFIQFNGDLQYFFEANDFHDLRFTGGGGGDSVTLQGGPGDDTADLFPGGGFLSGTRQIGTTSRPYRFEALDAESVMADGGGGTSNTLTLRGTASDDTFLARPGQFATTSAAGLAAGKGFGVVNYFPGAGGSDSAVVYGSAGDDALTVSPEGFSLTAPGYSVAIAGVPNLRVFAGHGDDSLTFSGGANPASLVTMPGQITINSGVFNGRFYGFDRFTANQGTGGASAALYDSALNDVLRGSPTSTQLAGPGYDYRLNNFANVRTFASTGQDLALFSAGSVAGVQFTATPTARLSGLGFSVEGLGFDTVRGPATPPSAAPPPADAADGATLAALAMRAAVGETSNDLLSLVDAAFDADEDWLP